MRIRRSLLGSLAAFVTFVAATHCANQRSLKTAREAPRGEEPVRDPETIGVMGERVASEDAPRPAPHDVGSTRGRVVDAPAAGLGSGDRAPRGTTRDEELAMAREFGSLGLVSGSGGSGASDGARAATSKPGAPSAVGHAFGDEAELNERHRSAYFQAGSGIRAGEWDDNANYREFMKYALTAAQTNPRLHAMDLAKRRFLVVRDNEGKPVPRCPVSVRDEAGHAVTLTTVASGRAILFPYAEGLGGGTLRAKANCTEGSAAREFTVHDADGMVELALDAPRRLPQTRTIDVGFVLDTTGSMTEEIEAVKAAISKVASSLDSDNARVRVGLVEYKDRTDPFVARLFHMTTDVAAFSRQVSFLSAGGGGDLPEAVNEGLHAGLTRLAWSDESVARFAFLVGDAPPHLDYPNDYDYAKEAQSAAHRGIQVFTVAASGMDDVGQAVWRQVAQYTGATNLFVLRGGAGPQSTGAGDPKTSCGTRIDNYRSGNLDELIVKKIRRELQAIDQNPTRIAGLYEDENQKPCDKRVAWQD